MTPTTSDSCAINEPADLTREQLVARITQLERDLELIKAGKEAAERMLRQDRERALELAQNSNLTLRKDWEALVNEFRLLNGQEIGTDPRDNKEFQEALAIDFCNRFRMGMLADLETDEDEKLFVKAKCYEIAYKCCTYVMANRNLKVKISKTTEFEQTKRDIKEKAKAQKRAKEEEKEDHRRRTPEEKRMDNLLLLGMSESEAKELIAAMDIKAKQMIKEKTQ